MPETTPNPKASELTLGAVQEYLKANADKDEVRNYIKGFTTPDGIKSYIETEDGLKLIQPKLDQHFTKGLETWKANNLQKTIDAEVEKVVTTRYPKETEEQKRLHKLEKDLEFERLERKKSEILMAAITEVSAKGLPVEYIKDWLGDCVDTDTMKAKILNYEKLINSVSTKEKQDFEKKYGRLPEKERDKNEGLFTKEQVQKMTPEEVKKNREKIHKSMAVW